MEVRLVLRATRYPDTASRTQLWERLIERLQRIPDIASWTISMALPSDRGLSEVIGLQIEGRDLPSDATHVWLSDHTVTSEYFRVVQPRVVRGRLFSADDDLGGTDAVVIAAHVEKTLWRGASALGKRVRFGTNDSWHTVVGVIADQGVPNVGGSSALEVYFPDTDRGFNRRRAMLVRTTPEADERRVIASIVSTIRRVDQSIPIVLARPEADILADQIARPRFTSRVMSGFGLAAVALAAIGLFSLIAASVRQRRKELTLRAALGASGLAISAEVVRMLGAPVVGGIACGVGIAFATTRILAGTLYSVTPLDPIALGGAVTILAFAALCASVGPVANAVRADPATVLRED